MEQWMRTVTVSRGGGFEIVFWKLDNATQKELFWSGTGLEWSQEVHRK